MKLKQGGLSRIKTRDLGGSFGLGIELGIGISTKYPNFQASGILSTSITCQYVRSEGPDAKSQRLVAIIAD